VLIAMRILTLVSLLFALPALAQGPAYPCPTVAEKLVPAAVPGGQGQGVGDLGGFVEHDALEGELAGEQGVGAAAGGADDGNGVDEGALGAAQVVAGVALPQAEQREQPKSFQALGQAIKEKGPSPLLDSFCKYPEALYRLFDSSHALVNILAGRSARVTDWMSTVELLAFSTSSKILISFA
jgi:hypothetical protein